MQFASYYEGPWHIPRPCSHCASTQPLEQVRDMTYSLPTWTFTRKFTNVEVLALSLPFLCGQPVIIPEGSTRCFDFEGRSEESWSSWNIFFYAHELFPRCAHIYKQRLSWNKPQCSHKLQPDSSFPSYSYLLWGECMFPWTPFTTVMEIFSFWLTVKSKARDMGPDLSQQRQNTSARCATSKSRCYGTKPARLTLL